MRKFIKRVIFCKALAKLLIKPILRCHSLCYKLAGQYAIILNGGIHPKHRILRYKEWFLENIQPGWTILDIGSNTGMLSLTLAEKASFVYGIESDKKHVTIAKIQYARDNIEYIYADATQYDYSSCRSINCIVLSNVLEHFEHRVDFLNKITRQIKWADENHKYFLIRVPIIDREWTVLYKKEQGLDYRLDPTHCIEYTLESFAKEMDEAGIKIINADTRFAEIYAVCEASNELMFSHTK